MTIKVMINGAPFYLTYAHLSQQLVSEGVGVWAGQMVALSGKTGTTGAHLHLEFRNEVAYNVEEGTLRTTYTAEGICKDRRVYYHSLIAGIGRLGYFFTSPLTLAPWLKGAYPLSEELKAVWEHPDIKNESDPQLGKAQDW